MKTIRQLIDDLKKAFASNTGALPKADEYDVSDKLTNGFFEAVKTHGEEALLENSDQSQKVIRTLESSVKAEALATLRYAYQNLAKTIDPSNDAVVAEDLYSAIPDLTPTEHRIEAIDGLNRFAELMPDQKPVVGDLKNLILEGSDDSIKTASAVVKTIYATKTPSRNLRVAYTTLNTQFGEPYQLCPKAKVELGYPIPMELSKCRDYCIDSRKNADGEVSCAYQDWLRVVADNQLNVMARLDAQKLETDNGETLNDITRPGPSDAETPREQYFENSKMLKEQNKYYKRESLLDGSVEKTLRERNLNNKVSSAETRTITASNENNTREAQNMSKKFNLQSHIKSVSINDKLDEYREFFQGTLGTESPSQMTNKFEKTRFEDPNTSMEKLIETRRNGAPNAETVLNQQLETKRKSNEAQLNSTMDETLGQRRKNESFNAFMETLEEKLEARRTNK